MIGPESLSATCLPEGTPAPRTWRAAKIAILAVVCLIPSPDIGMFVGPVMLAVVFQAIWGRGESKRWWLSWQVLGVLAGLVIFLPGWQALAEYSVRASLPQPMDVSCQANVKALWRIVEAYETQNGRSPEAKELFQDESVRRMQCPFRRREGKHGDSYFYFPPAWGAKDHRLVICDLQQHDKWSQKRSVAFSDDDNARSLTPKAFEAELAKPKNADFAAAFVAAGGQN